MLVTLLAAGPAGTRLAAALAQLLDTDAADRLTVIAGTGGDLTLHGLRRSPVIDGVIDALASAPTPPGEGRAATELAALGVEPGWWPVSDEQLAVDLARTSWLTSGIGLSEVTARLAARHGLPERGVTVLPMSEVPVETHVVLDDEESHRALHIQEWRRAKGGQPAPVRVVAAGMDRATPAPSVLDAIRRADLLVLAPDDPVSALGVLLTVPGVRDAVRGCTAPVVGVDPVTMGDAGLEDSRASLAMVGLPPTSAGAATSLKDLLDGWVSAEPAPGRWRSATSGTSAPEMATAVLELGSALRS